MDPRLVRSVSDSHVSGVPPPSDHTSSLSCSTIPISPHLLCPTTISTLDYSPGPTRPDHSVISSNTRVRVTSPFNDPPLHPPNSCPHCTKLKNRIFPFTHFLTLISCPVFRTSRQCYDDVVKSTTVNLFRPPSSRSSFTNLNHI